MRESHKSHEQKMAAANAAPAHQHAGGDCPGTRMRMMKAQQTAQAAPVAEGAMPVVCLLYTSDAADDLLCVDLGGRRISKKKKQHK